MQSASDVFEHTFSDSVKAPARRWKNPDGSEGGIVGVDNNDNYLLASADSAWASWIAACTVCLGLENERLSDIKSKHDEILK